MNVTVVICTWNRSLLLRQTLEHMCKLRVPAGVTWELLVVDNNSSDDTQDVLENFQGQLPIRTLFEPRQGKSLACNLAIEEARGEILLWTDDDVCPDDGWLEASLNAFNEFDADIVFGVIRPRWLSGRPKWFGERFCGRFALLDFGPEPFVASEQHHAFYGANYAARRGVFDLLGGFREDLGPTGEAGLDEDTDFFLRALSRGMTIVYEPRSVVGHMIDTVRCTKAHHRRRTWKSCESYFRLLQAEAATAAQVLNLPRYMYRIAFADTWSYVKSLAKLDRSASFHYELRLLQFAGVFWQALRHRRRWLRNGQSGSSKPEVTERNS